MKHAKRIGRQRQRRRLRVRNALKRHATRPRLSVFRSHKHMYAQVIDDQAGRTLAAASTLDKELRGQLRYGGNVAAAAAVGRLIAQRALAAGVTKAYLDRREYKYHGRVAALADAARDAGLDLGPKPQPPAEETPKAAQPTPKKEKAPGKAKSSTSKEAAKKPSAQPK